jgi:hypothetical protein
MTTLRKFSLAHSEARAAVANFAQNAPEGTVVTFSEPTRSEESSAAFHALCGDLSKQLMYAGKKLTKDQWKVLLISGHSVATKQGAEIVPGLENEFVNIRESSRSMGIKRMASLIEYATAYAVSQGVRLSAPERWAA